MKEVYSFNPAAFLVKKLEIYKAIIRENHSLNK